MSELKYIANESNYIIYVDSGTYYAKNGNTGKVESSNATLNTLLTTITTTLGASGGVISLKEIQFNYTFTIPEKVLIREIYQGKIREFINVAQSMGSPYTISTATEGETVYYFCQDSEHHYINSLISINAYTVFRDTVNSVYTGGTVYIKKGTYIPIIYPVGADGSPSTNNVYIKGELGTIFDSTGQPWALKITGTNNIIDGIKFISNRVSVYVEGDNNTFTNCEFEQSDIFDPVAQCIISLASDRNTIKNCKFSGGLFGVYNNIGNNNTVKNNIFTNSIKTCVYVGSIGNLINKNQFDGVENGIILSQTASLNKITENNMINFIASTGCGIGGNGMKHNLISKNIIDCNDLVYYGIDIEWTNGTEIRPDGNTVTENIVTNAVADGILIFHCDNTIVSQNQTYGNTYNGIKIYDGLHITINSNICNDNVLYGLVITLSSDVVGCANIAFINTKGAYDTTTGNTNLVFEHNLS